MASKKRHFSSEPNPKDTGVKTLCGRNSFWLLTTTSEKYTNCKKCLKSLKLKN